MNTRPKIRTYSQRFDVGDQVVFRLVNRNVRGVIVEDLGPIAAGGRGLFRVQANFGPDEIMMFEIPDDELATREADLKNTHCPV